MEHIISPWFIYLLHLVGGLVGGFTVIAIFIGIALFVCGIYFMEELIDLNSDDKERLSFKRWVRRLITAGIISLLLAIFIPSKTTLIGMFVANKVTYNNVEKAIEAGKNVKEELKKDIIDIIEAIQKEDAEKK
jgi:hypothetical protein